MSSIGPISDFAIGIYDGPHATPKPSAEGPIFLGIKNVTEDGRLDLENVRHISETDFPKWTRRVKPQKDDIVFSYEATLHRYARIPDGFEGCLGRRMALVRPNRKKVDPRFLHYYFLSPIWRAKIDSITITGVTVDRIPLSSFPDTKVSIPELSEQVKIANILSAYDDLIENNRRRIALLKEAARLLYREWFVHFRFPGHEHVKMIDGLPEGWVRRTLGSVLNFQRGFDLPVNWRVPGGVPVYGSTGIVGEHNVAKVDFPTLTTGRSGSLGRVCYVDDPCWPLNTSLWVTDFKAVSVYFAYFMLSAMDLAKFNAGASVPTLDRKVAHAVKVLVPTRDIAAQFDEQIKVVFTQKKLLNQQIEKLAQARDLLLPRLMNGDIAV
ncbi:MAG: restriction endonuclease subunit S [Rhodospirillaceae bacterium]|nr:restriction endonuclease subunit S [Rhodospirillaceae bacterium]